MYDTVKLLVFIFGYNTSLNSRKQYSLQKVTLLLQKMYHIKENAVEITVDVKQYEMDKGE